jgi:hypothetical protein
MQGKKHKILTSFLGIAEEREAIRVYPVMEE